MDVRRRIVHGFILNRWGLIIDLLAIGLNAGAAMAFGAIIVLPVLFGVFGIILGYLLELIVITGNKIKGSINKK